MTRRGPSRRRVRWVTDPYPVVECQPHGTVLPVRQRYGWKLMAWCIACHRDTIERRRERDRQYARTHRDERRRYMRGYMRQRRAAATTNVTEVTRYVTVLP